PGLSVLGPTRRLYKQALEESIGELVPAYGSFLSALAAAPSYPLVIPHLPANSLSSMLSPPASVPPTSPFSFLGGPLAPLPKAHSAFDLSTALFGALNKSSVDENP